MSSNLGGWPEFWKTWQVIRDPGDWAEFRDAWQVHVCEVHVDSLHKPSLVDLRSQEEISTRSSVFIPLFPATIILIL